MAAQEIVSRTIAGIVVNAIAWYWRMGTELVRQNNAAGNGLLRHWAQVTPGEKTVYYSRKGRNGKMIRKRRIVRTGEQVFRPYIDNFVDGRPRGLVRNYAQKLLKRAGVASYDFNILDDIAQEAQYLHHSRYYTIISATWVATQRYIQQRRGREDMVKVASDVVSLDKTLPREIADTSTNEVALLELGLDFPELFAAIDGDKSAAGRQRKCRIQKKIVAALFNNDIVRYTKEEQKERERDSKNEVRDRKRSKRKTYGKASISSMGMSVYGYKRDAGGQCHDILMNSKRAPERFIPQEDVDKFAEKIRKEVKADEGDILATEIRRNTREELVQLDAFDTCSRWVPKRNKEGEEKTIAVTRDFMSDCWNMVGQLKMGLTSVPAWLIEASVHA